MLRRLVILGSIAGGIYAVRAYMKGEALGTEESTQIICDDGSTRSLASNTAEGREFADIARRIVEIGL